MEVHRLKIQQEYFDAVKERSKNFELRKNDRNYKVGDMVVLEVPLTNQGVTCKIKYVLKDCPQYGLQDGYCIFGW